MSALTKERSVARAAGRAERILTRAFTFAAFLGLGFVILRYVIGAGHTLAWALAYIDAVISIGMVDLKERLDALKRTRPEGAA